MIALRLTSDLFKIFTKLLTMFKHFPLLQWLRQVGNWLGDGKF